MVDSPMTSPAQATVGLPEDRVLLILAADHRASLERDLYGLTAPPTPAQTGDAVSSCMPIEASGQDWFGFAYGQDWQQHAGFFATEHAKVQVRDNPGSYPAHREQQVQRLAQVSAWAAAAGRSLIIELLVPATDTDKAATKGSQDRYDDELRPQHTYLDYASYYLRAGEGTPAAIELAHVEESQHGQDPAVGVVGLREPQLCENAAHVFLHRSLGDPQLP